MPTQIKRYKNIKSEDGHTINDILKVCLKQKFDSGNCILVPSLNTFYAFEEIFSSYLKSEFPQPDLKESGLLFVSSILGLYIFDNFINVVVTPKVSEIFTDPPGF